MSYSVRRKPVVSIGDEPEHAHRAYFIGGAVSVALYGSFLIICIIRSILSFPKFKYSFENKKMVIHISLMTFGLFDLIYGISMMIEEEETVWGYSFHMFGQYAVLTSFSLIPLIWTKILSYGGNYRLVNIHIGLVLLSNILITIVQWGVLLAHKHLSEPSEHEVYVTIVRASILSASLLSFSVWLLIYGIRIYIFLSRSDVRTNEIIRNERRTAILRVIVVVLLCSICYLMRAFCVTLLIYDYFQGTYFADDWFSILGWYLCSQWIPALIPASIMLFVCRPVPRRKNRIQQELGPMPSTSYVPDEGMTTEDLTDHSSPANSNTSSRSPLFSEETSFRFSRFSRFALPATNASSSSLSEAVKAYEGHFERYSNDMYSEVDGNAYDYDPERETTVSNKPFTVDEILQSSDKYGASTEPVGGS